MNLLVVFLRHIRVSLAVVIVRTLPSVALLTRETVPSRAVSGLRSCLISFCTALDQLLAYVGLVDEASSLFFVWFWSVWRNAYNCFPSREGVDLGRIAVFVRLGSFCRSALVCQNCMFAGVLKIDTEAERLAI